MKLNEVDTSFWKRFIAYLVDIIIVDIIVAWPFQKTIDNFTSGFSSNVFAVYTSLNSNPDFISSMLPSLALLFLITSLLTIAYWAVLEYKTKQSIGKMLMRITVKSDYKLLTLNQCIVRNISKISGILLLIDCIGLIGSHQRFLERLSNTRVVEKRFTL